MAPKALSIPKKNIERARAMRKQPTTSEGLLWSILRSHQVCGLKFGRQHPIGHYIVDNACIEHRLVVEIDGGYHDQIIEDDLCRQKYLEENGWKVLRFSSDDVEDDGEQVARAIANLLGLKFSFSRRSHRGSGMKTD
jgi:very-short-patch-repair endonuclease